MNEEKVVLLIENDHHDAYLLRRALMTAGVSNRIIAVSDGEEAIDYLRGGGGYADPKEHPRPCLIITDLNMPRMDGFQFLEWLRAQKDLEAIPAIALSGSCLEKDMQRAVELGAEEYYVKPSQWEVFLQIARELKRKWLDVYCPAERPGCRA